MYLIVQSTTKASLDKLEYPIQQFLVYNFIMS